MDLIKIFMQRDDMTEDEARRTLKYMRERVAEGEDPEEVLYEEGLEPDYVLDLL